MPDPRITTLIERLRASDLPPDATIALYFTEPGRSVGVALEIQSIQRGEVPPIKADIDQVTAFLVIAYLEGVILRGANAHPVDLTARRFIDDLERALARDCPNLAAVLTGQRAETEEGGDARG